MQESSVPILVTLDVHQMDDKADQYVREASSKLEVLGIPATFFVPCIVLEENAGMAESILAGGHQIASHGLYHNSEPFKGLQAERYDLLSADDQRFFIEEKTRRFEKMLGFVPSCFRSPCFGISGPTISLLEEFGYRADFSVNSQRVDFFSANPFSTNMMFAPRLPYHPSLDDPYRKGDAGLWEIPISAAVFPFAVMFLITFGMTLTKAFFRAFCAESRRTGKPVVYMLHPEEFSPRAATYTLRFRDLRPMDFLPRKGAGIRARQAFRLGDPAKICSKNIEFLEYMRDTEGTQFVSGDQYLERLDGE